MRYTSLLALGLLVACGGDDVTDSATGTAPACETTLSGVWPEDGTPDVFFASTIELTLSALDGTETIDVTDAAGNAVAGTTATDGNTIIFTPDGGLASSTTYNVSYGWCNGPTDVSWSTSLVGDPATPADLIDRTYLLDLASGRWVQPEGIGSMIGGLIGDEAQVFIGVTDATDTEVSLMGAVGDGSGGQDICTETFDFPIAADFSGNPLFSVESDALELAVAGYDVEIEDLVISGAFAPDGSLIAGAVLEGTLDVNLLAGVVGDDPCALLVAVGVTCEECSDGTGPHCLSVVVQDMTAEELPGVTLVPRTADDVAADPQCDSGTATGTGTSPTAP